MAKKSKNLKKVNMNKHVRIDVTQEDIEGGKCRDPNKCMIKIATVRAIGMHGQIKVGTDGISISRKDYRERAFLPKKVQQTLLLFDNLRTRDKVKPFSFKVAFLKIKKIYKYTPEQKERRNANRRNNNQPSRRRKYSLHMRVAGIAVEREFAREFAGDS